MQSTLKETKRRDKKHEMVFPTIKAIEQLVKSIEKKNRWKLL